MRNALTRYKCLYIYLSTFIRESKILFTKLFESLDQGKEANKVEQDTIPKTGEFRTV